MDRVSNFLEANEVDLLASAARGVSNIIFHGTKKCLIYTPTEKYGQEFSEESIKKSGLDYKWDWRPEYASRYAVWSLQHKSGDKVAYVSNDAMTTLSDPMEVWEITVEVPKDHDAAKHDKYPNDKIKPEWIKNMRKKKLPKSVVQCFKSAYGESVELTPTANKTLTAARKAAVKRMIQLGNESLKAYPKLAKQMKFSTALYKDEPEELDDFYQGLTSHITIMEGDLLEGTDRSDATLQEMFALQSKWQHEFEQIISKDPILAGKFKYEDDGDKWEICGYIRAIKPR